MFSALSLGQLKKKSSLFAEAKEAAHKYVSGARFLIAPVLGFTFWLVSCKFIVVFPPFILKMFVCMHSHTQAPLPEHSTQMFLLQHTFFFKERGKKAISMNIVWKFQRFIPENCYLRWQVRERKQTIVLKGLSQISEDPI